MELRPSLLVTLAKADNSGGGGCGRGKRRLQWRAVCLQASEGIKAFDPYRLLFHSALRPKLKMPHADGAIFEQLDYSPPPREFRLDRHRESRRYWLCM